MMQLKSLTLLLGAFLSGALAAPSAPRALSPQVVPNKFIITLKNDLIQPQVDSHLSWVENVHRRSLGRRDGQEATGGVDKVWSASFKGYSGEFDATTIAEIQASEEVLAVEPVAVWELYDLTNQEGAPWGLGSISHRTPDHTTYVYDESAGEGTWAYIIDTGLYTDHETFEGRGHLGYNAYPNVPFEDRNGHGTHVAGTIIGKDYGVVKKANVISVKVFDTGSSTTEIVLDGYEWAVGNITATPGRAAVSVLSLSLGGPKSEAFNAAVEAAYQQGILSVVAAGNSFDDAGFYSPASAPNALTIGAVDVTNTKPGFSNFGALVDVFAPGVDVLSSWIGSTTAVNTISGTSMATPHVAGLALYLKALEGLVAPGDVSSRIVELSTKDVVASPGTNSPNRLAFNGAAETTDEE